jgi:glutathione S-transferase
LDLLEVQPATLEAQVAGDNPLGKIPCLITDDGERLYDSPVICEYLDVTHNAGRLHPATGTERWAALRLQALADGIMDSAVALRYESLRPEHLQSAEWLERQRGKILRALDHLETALPADPLSIGDIALACALDYLDLRMPELGWRQGRPALARWAERLGERPSLMATVPVNV